MSETYVAVAALFQHLTHMLETFAPSITTQLAVVPILVGPLQVLLAMLPAILLGLGSALLALFKPATFKVALRLLWRLKLSVLVLALVLGGSIFAARSVRRHSERALGTAENAARDWPMFRGGPQRTGALAGSAAPVRGGVNWSFASDAKTFHASPAIVGNRVYATSAEVGVFSTRGAIYCLDADTGAVVWKSAPEGFRATFSSPSVSGKYLVTGEGLHQTQDGRISCLDVTKGGALLWSYRTKSHVESSAAIFDGRAYIGAGDDGYYCFELEPDAHGNPVMLWHLAGENYPDAESAPVVHNGRVYFGLGLNGQAVVCVDAENGRELWRVRTPFPVFSPPTLARGKVFVGMGHGNFVESVEQIIAAQAARLRAEGKSETFIAEMAKAWPLHGEIWCIDAKTQEVEWRFRTDRAVFGAVVAGDERLYFASRAGTVYSVDLQGKALAHWSARAPILASPALTASHLYVVSENGRLFALEQASLQPAWEASLSAGGICLSSPAVARGHVYVGSPSNGVLCVGRASEDQGGPVWAGYLAGAGRGGNVDDSPLPASAAIEWRWPDDAREEPPVISAPAAAINGQLFVSVAKGARKGLHCIRAEDARGLWSSAGLELAGSVAASSRQVAFVERGLDGAGQRLQLLDARSGARMASVELAAEVSGALCLTAEGVLVEDGVGQLASYDYKGRKVWRTSFGGGALLSGPPAVIGGMVVASTAQADALYAIDRFEGGELWRVALRESPLTGPAVHHKTVFLGTRTGIVAHRLIDGQPLWHAQGGEMRTALAVGKDFVCAVNVAGELVLVEAASGEIRVRIPGALPHFPPLLAPDAILYASRDGVMRCDLATKTAALWLSTTEFGAITSPMISANSAVYFATAKAGMIRAGEPRP